MRFLCHTRCLSWAAAAVFACSCHAQVMQAPGTMPDGRRMHLPGLIPHPTDAPPQPARPQGAPPPGMRPVMPAQPVAPSTALATPVAPASALPPSLSDKPAQPARVTLSAGSLSVDANNSSLSKILDDLASSSGMTVDGLSQKDQRVFGIYGPGNPRDVLSELLDGAGYNFLMVGTTETGTPREVVLTARSNAPLPSAQNGQPSTPEPEDEEPPPNNYPDEANPPGRLPNGLPGAQPRSPAEMMQEMQRRQQQLQQQQQQPMQPQQPQ